MRSFRLRLQACITNEGRHMPEVVYRKLKILWNVLNIKNIEFQYVFVFLLNFIFVS